MNDNNERTFESRLLFISSIFEEKFPPFVIMAKCIEHKLDWNYAQYCLELNSSSDSLNSRDPIKLMKKINF